MKLVPRGVSIGKGDTITVTISVLDDDESYIFEDRVNLSTDKSRTAFIDKVADKTGLDRERVELAVNQLIENSRQAATIESEVNGNGSNGHDRDAWASKYWHDALALTDRLTGHGRFVKGGQTAYYFDDTSRRLMTIEKEELPLRALLNRRYQINRQDTLYSYLIEHLEVHAHERGQDALVRQFSYYDMDNNFVLLDMGEGRVLKITDSYINEVDNGADGVLFAPLPDHDPWRYVPSAPENALYLQMIEPVNFSDEGVFSIDQEKLLLMVWMVSLAFESMMNTRPLLLAVGPGESGKSSLFRYIGRLLIGREFEVDSPLQDQKGEEEFWTNTSNSFFVCYDNVDQFIRWMPDALAQVATGIRRSKRQLHTTNQLRRFSVRCMLALTARTPTYSLRREDVASRMLIFNLKPLDVKRGEYEIAEEIRRNRASLMSDYARLVQKALRVPLSSVEVSDPGMRLADFARVSTRIAMGLGAEIHQLANDAFRVMRDSQFVFATEEDELASTLEIWIHKSVQPLDNQMNVGPVANNGRKVLVRDLQMDLRGIADQFKMGWHISTPEQLGKRLRNMEQALSRTYEIERGRGKKGIWISFTLKPQPEIEEALENVDF